MKKMIILAVAAGLATALTARADAAKDNWNSMCAKCHGSDGKGQTKMGQRLGARDYTDPQVQSSIKDEDIAKAIKEGFKNKDDRTVMKPAEGLSDADVKALVDYVRSLKK